MHLPVQGRDGSAAARAAAEAELALTERAIRKNLKSYAAWHHRRWVVEKGLTPLERELGLLGTYVVHLTPAQVISQDLPMHHVPSCMLPGEGLWTEACL